jgi:hypothetical protein
MLRKVFITGFLFVSVVAVAGAQIIATDNFENNNPGTAYNDGIQYGDNGGVAFGPLTYLEGTNGGLFDASLSGARALGVFASSGGQALGRTTQTPFEIGMYSLDARFDLDNSNAFSGFNIKSGLGSTFGANELMSFGLTPGSGNAAILVTDASGTHSLSIPTVTEFRGVNFHFAVAFDTLADTYTLTVTDLANSLSNSFSGTLKDTNGVTPGTGALSALGFANFNTGTNQNLVADNLAVVPEPSTGITAGTAVVGLALFRRRRTAKI